MADGLTDIAGSSGYVLGGVVAYSDAVKVTQLGVPAELLVTHGAVSAHVARAMAAGAQERFGATLAVAVTGIAGPGGGSDAKPVGLTYLGLAGPEGVEVRRFVWQGDRLANKRASAHAAIALLIEVAERLATDPAYATTAGGRRAGRCRSDQSRPLSPDDPAGPAAEIARGLEPSRPPRPIPAGQRIHVLGAAGSAASASLLLAAAAGARTSGCDSGRADPVQRRRRGGRDPDRVAS